MPNTKSAAKSMRTDEARYTANKAVKSRLSTTRRRLIEAIEAGDKSKSDEVFRTYTSHLDKAVKGGTIKANNASRRKSRIAKKIAALS